MPAYMKLQGNRPFLILAALLALLASPAVTPAQCSELANTGCPGATAVQCGGSTSIGQTLELTCLNQGRATLQVLFLGRCNLTPLVLGPPLMCVAGPCYLAIDLFPPVITLNTQFQKVTATIPPDPLLVGQTICAQCIELVGTGSCFALSQAISITFQP